MEKIEITIQSSDVFAEVRKKTEYLGAKNNAEDTEFYKKIRANKYNDEILKDFFKEACSTADTQLKKYLSTNIGVSQPDTVYKADLTIGKRFNQMLTDRIVSSMKDFFVMYVTGRWLDLCSVEKSTEYMTTAMANLSDLLVKLENKTRPQKAARSEDNETKGTAGAEGTPPAAHDYVKGKTT